MAKLKCYSCPECGSFLEVDRVSDTFDCPFCGSHFEAFDFHGEDLLKQAKTLLLKNDYRLAREKYEFLLSKNPERFEFLYGYACAVAEYSSLRKFSSIENYDDKLPKFFSEDTRYCNGPYSAYFGKFAEMFSIAKRYEQIPSEQENLNKTAEEEFIALEKDQEFQNNIYGIIIIVYYLVSFIWGLPFLGTLVLKFLPIKEMIYVILGIIILLPIPVFKIAKVIHKKVKLEPRAKEFEERLAHVNSLKAKVDELEAEKEDLIKAHTDAVNELINFRKNEGLVLLAEPKSKITSRFTQSAIPSRSVFGKKAGQTKPAAPKKAGVCKKCGAELKLDKTRKLYVCDHCGSSYDFAMFLGDPIAKATKSLNSGDFDLADKWFSVILDEDPSDFEANRGRILCAGKWHTTAQISLQSDLTKIDWDNLKKRLDAAIENAEDSDREYFVMFDDLTKTIQEYIDLCNSLKGLTLRNKYLEKKKESMAESFNDKLRPIAKFDIERVREIRMAGMRR